ncbi:hypothetical protein K1719_031885 [Acacia pycnantha]|nr:hypothetical protein K1719_031885 [Acacia pycnantha]
MIHIGLVLIRVTGLTRSELGGQVLVNLVDTRYSGNIQKAIIGTMEIDMTQNCGITYMAPKMQLPIRDFANHFQLIIKTRGYEEFTTGQNLVVTKILTARLSNHTNNNFKLQIDRVMQHLSSQGVVELESDDENNYDIILVLEDSTTHPANLLDYYYPDYDWKQDFNTIPHPDDCTMLIQHKYQGQYPCIFTNPFASECQRSVVGSDGKREPNFFPQYLGTGNNLVTMFDVNPFTFEQNEYELPYPQQSKPPKWDEESPILVNESVGSGSGISNFNRIPKQRDTRIPMPNFRQTPTTPPETG